jgi:hypothetical protein
MIWISVYAKVGLYIQALCIPPGFLWLKSTEEVSSVTSY